MKKHGNEPWSSVEVTNDEDQLIKIRASNGANIARLWIDVDDNHFSDEQRENARRIVACVNACRGLPTDELEQKGLVAAVGTQLLDVEQQRDVLLAALDEILQEVVNMREDYPAEAWRFDQDMINRIEGLVAKGGAA